MANYLKNGRYQGGSFRKNRILYGGSVGFEIYTLCGRGASFKTNGSFRGFVVEIPRDLDKEKRLKVEGAFDL